MSEAEMLDLAIPRLQMEFNTSFVFKEGAFADDSWFVKHRSDAVIIEGLHNQDVILNPDNNEKHPIYPNYIPSYKDFVKWEQFSRWRDGMMTTEVKQVIGNFTYENWKNTHFLQEYKPPDWQRVKKNAKYWKFNRPLHTKLPLIAIEAKLKDTLSAIIQAARYKVYADESYILMPRDTLTKTSWKRNSELATMLGVGWIWIDSNGLVYVSRSSGGCKCRFEELAKVYMVNKILLVNQYKEN